MEKFLGIKNFFLPPSACAQRKQSNHTTKNIPKVKDFVDHTIVFYIHKQVHSKNTINKYDQKE